MKRNAKKQMVSIAFILVFTMMITCCDEQEDNPIVKDPALIELVNFSNSGCKTSSQTRSATVVDEEQESAIVKAMKDGKLYVEHKNAMFNCGVTNLQGSIESTEGHIIKLFYKYDLIKMDCKCPIDTSYIIDGLEEGESYSLYISNSNGEEKVVQFIYNMQLDENVKL